MSVKCSAITHAGQRCNASAKSGQWCYSHDPAQAEQRKRNASKGGKRAGRGRPSVSPELEEIKGQLRTLLAGVLSGRYETGMVSVANQVQNTRLRLIEVERKLEENAELEARIEAIEQQIEAGATKIRRYS